jgi:hypothetical protein
MAKILTIMGHLVFLLFSITETCIPSLRSHSSRSKIAIAKRLAEKELQTKWFDLV